LVGTAIIAEIYADSMVGTGAHPGGVKFLGKTKQTGQSTFVFTSLYLEKKAHSQINQSTNLVFEALYVIAPVQSFNCKKNASHL
jgi:hypothetical protein